MHNTSGRSPNGFAKCSSAGPTPAVAAPSPSPSPNNATLHFNSSLRRRTRTRDGRTDGRTERLRSDATLYLGLRCATPKMRPKARSRLASDRSLKVCYDRTLANLERASKGHLAKRRHTEGGENSQLDAANTSWVGSNVTICASFYLL